MEAAEQQLEAARCALRFLQDYRGPEREQIPLQLLGALAELTQAYLQKEVPPSKIKFTPAELIQQALTWGLKKTPDKDDAAKWLHRHWKKLNDLLAEFKEPLLQAARDEAVQQLPVLTKEQSPGGPGNYSYYALLAEPLPLATADLYPVPPGGIRYQAERRRPARLSWLWHIGVPLTRRRRVIASIPFALIYGFGVLVAVGPFILAPLTGHRLSLAAVVSVAVTIIMAAAILYVVVGPFFITRFQRVMRVPDWLMPLREIDPCVLEWVEEPALSGDQPAPSIQVVRYTGVCPICQGRVVVGGGGLAFWGRLVGRCQRSPREHVFSFDHVTRSGYPLRYRSTLP
jgi:hypothetical protein